MISLNGFDDPNEVVYKTRDIIFFFSRSSVIEYCNGKDTTINYNSRYKQLLSYLLQNNQKQLIIPDTLGTKLVMSKTINQFSDPDTLIRVRNQESQCSYVTDALDWMLLDIIETGNLKVFDPQTNEFIDSVVFYEENTNTSGSKNILTKKGKLLFSKMTWIQ